MKKQLLVEDFTTIFQWVVAVLLTPFILLPLFLRQPVSFTVRLGIVIGVYLGNTIATLVYLWMRPRSRRYAICLMIRAEGETLGVMHIRSHKPGAFREEDQQLALAIADQVALALQRALLFEEINRLAVTDPLTGVFNIRRLESVLKEEVGRARRYEHPLSFLMVDVDNLKSYNDTLGHQKGDLVLSKLASIIDSNTREVDKVFRYGGDEFCVVLPETNSSEARVVADKVRRAVGEFHFPGEEKVPEGGITVSLGVATLEPDAGDGEALVRQADVSLYEAKQRGRNSVVVSGNG